MRGAATGRWLGVLVALATLGAPRWVQAQLAGLDDVAFTREAAARFKAALPASDVRIVGPRTLTLRIDNSVVNLDRTRLWCDRVPRDCASQLDALIAGVANALRAANASADPAQLRVVVRSESAPSFAGVRLADSGDRFQWRSLGDGLAGVVVLDAPTTVAWVLPKDVAALHLESPQLWARAVANLHDALRPFDEAVPPVEPGVIGMVRGDGAYAASRLLFPEDWRALAARHGALVVAVPRPPSMYYVTDDSPATIAALRARVRASWSGAPDALSTVLLRWTPDGWRPL